MDRISVFGPRPYDTAIHNLKRIGHTDPKEYLTDENPKYEPLLYCRFVICMLFTMSMNVMMIPHEIFMIVTHLMPLILIKPS